jgi:hypothetical protein
MWIGSYRRHERYEPQPQWPRRRQPRHQPRSQRRQCTPSQRANGSDQPHCPQSSLPSQWHWNCKGPQAPKVRRSTPQRRIFARGYQGLREHGEYVEMRGFRNQNNVGCSTNAVATSDRQDGDAASYAEQSIHSNGTRSYLSGDTASLRSNDRGNAMVVTGRPRSVTVPTSYVLPGHRHIDNSPSWMRNPQFVSEAHATKSRQSATAASLGVRWEAPTSRAIEALARGPQPVTKSSAKPAQSSAPKMVPKALLKAPPPAAKNLVDYSSSSNDSHDEYIQSWGRPTAPVVPPIVVVATPPVSARAIAAALTAAKAAANTVANPAPTDAAVAGEAAPHSTYSIFGTDSKNDEATKGKQHKWKLI